MDDSDNLGRNDEYKMAPLDGLNVDNDDIGGDNNEAEDDV